MPDYSERDDSWRQNYSSPNVTPQQPMTPDSSVTPSPDTSGLYAIYGKRNPYTAEANRYSAMAGRDMGGRLGQLPGIVATIMAARAEAKSEQFEESKQKQIDAFLIRKEAYDKIKNDRETRQYNAKYLSDTIFPAAQQEYARVLSESKDVKAASAAATQVANKMAADQGIPAPEVVAFNAWKGATSMSVINDKGETSTAVYKDGAMMVQNNKGDLEPPTEKWLSLKDTADLLDSQARAQKSQTSGLKGKEHIYLTANGELITSTDPYMAQKQGAVKVMIDTTDQDGIKVSKEFYLPGKAPKEEAKPEAQPAEQPKSPSVLSTAAGAIANQLRPSGGGMAGAVSRMVGGQPQSQPAAQAPQAQPLRRTDPKSGKIALYDPNTKAFIRWE